MPLSLKSSARSLARALVPESATVPILAGPAKGLRVPKELAIAYPSLLAGKYESGLTKAFQSVKRPVKVVYDIGAHVGLTSLTLAGIYGSEASILAFEPAQQNVSALHSIVQANPNVEINIYPFALSNTVGQVEFCAWKGSSTGLLKTIAAEDNSAGPVEASYKVTSTTLDRGIFREKWPPPDVMKIDVEGAEFLVLAGGQEMLRKYRPALVLELHGPKHALEVYDLLSSFPYSWRYVHPNSGPGEEITTRSQLNAYFGRDDKWTQHVILQQD